MPDPYDRKNFVLNINNFFLNEKKFKIWLDSSHFHAPQIKNKKFGQDQAKL